MPTRTNLLEDAERFGTNSNYGLEEKKPGNIRVLIFSSDDYFTDLIAPTLLNTEGICLRGTFKKGNRIVQRIREIQPDVILVDVKLSDMCSLEAVRLIRSTFPNIKIIMLGTSDEDEMMVDAICAGAIGCMLKNEPHEKIVETFIRLQQGETLLSPFVLRKVIELLHNLNVPKRMSEYNLSAREKEVLSLMVEGGSYKIISARLGIRYDTVHNHIRNIYSKLQVNSMSEAISKVLKAQMNWSSKVAGSFLLPLFLWITEIISTGYSDSL